MKKSVKRRIFEVSANLFLAPWFAMRLRQKGVTPRVLFILSHPRSGSTMLQHILSSHPSMLGYGENKLPYHSRYDLTKLITRTALILKDFSLEETYFVDKIVWRNFDIDEEMLQCERCRFIFLLREPEPTITSMLRMPDTWKTQESACGYYVDQLAWLEEMAETVHNEQRAFFVTYSYLTEHAQPTLEALTCFLDLDEPLNDSYELLPTTGRWGFGDVSKHIAAGKIVAHVADPESLCHVSEEVWQAYLHCGNTLCSLCAIPPRMVFPEKEFVTKHALPYSTLQNLSANPQE